MCRLILGKNEPANILSSLSEALTEVDPDCIGLDVQNPLLDRTSARNCDMCPIKKKMRCRGDVCYLDPNFFPDLI